jgi:general secretion pathway protein C
MKFRRPTVENKGWTWWLGCALSLCLLLGAIAYWASIWLAPAVRIAPAGTLSDQSGQINLSQAQGLFGQIAAAAAPVATATSSNIKVVGILAAGQKGSAILAIDGKPGKVFTLGDKVDGDLKLISVDMRQVTLGQDGRTTRQTLAAPPKAEISVLTQGPNKLGVAGTTTPATGASPSPSLSPAPSPITPPPSSMLSPPPQINTGASGNIVNGLPPQGMTPPPAPPGPPGGGPNQGAQTN